LKSKDDDIVVDVTTLASVFACDERSVRSYAERKIAVRAGRGRYYLKASTRNLIQHLRDTASGRGGAAAVETLTAERARLAREQADAHALKNKITRGELVEASAVTERWSDICAQIRARLLAIPTIYCADVPGAGRAEIDILDRLIREALTGLADELAQGNTDD
jgi:phage terminase Nu1 subunit (DNA packaging protein)